MTPDDELTLRRAQSGDAEARAWVLGRHSRGLRFLVARFFPASEVEDQMQELYLKLLDALPRYRIGGPAQLGTWIYTVAHHLLVQHRRRPKLELVPLEEAHHVPDGRRSAEGLLESDELRRRLERGLETLREPLRRVFVLAQLHGQPLESIAEVEGVPLGTVKSRLHRARAELSIALGAALDTEPPARVQEGGTRGVTGRR